MAVNNNHKGFKLTTGDATGKQLAILVPTDYRVLHIASSADQATDWNVANPTHPTLYVHSETTPATDYVSIAHDGTTATFTTAGADYFTFTGSDFVIANGYGTIIGNTAQITANSAAEFQVLGTALADSSAIIGAFSADAVGPEINFVKGRSATIGGLTIVQDNDIIGKIVWLPADGADLATEAAVFQAEVDDGSPAAGDVGMAFVWRAMPGGGGAIADVLRLSAAGDLVPGVSDQGGLGTGTLMWGDLFLASAGVINFGNGNATLTHQAGDTQGKLKFDVTLANAAMDDGYGVFEVNANLTGTTTSWVAASSAWVNINTATAGAGVMIAPVNNGIYEAGGGTVTSAYLAYGGRYQAILGDGDATRLAVFSLNVSGDTATSFLVVDSTDGKEVGLVIDATSDSSKVADIPFLMTADGTIRYIRLYNAAS